MTATWTANRTWTTGEVVTAAYLNQYLRDNLDWLKGRPVIYASDFDLTVYSTTSSTFQDTGLSATLTTTGGRVMVVAFGTLGGNTASNWKILSLYQDGTTTGDATYGTQIALSAGNATLYHPFSIVYITPTAPTAASHTWKLYMRNSDNTNAVTIVQYQMWAIEIGA